MIQNLMSKRVNNRSRITAGSSGLFRNLYKTFEKNDHTVCGSRIKFVSDIKRPCSANGTRMCQLKPCLRDVSLWREDAVSDRLFFFILSDFNSSKFQEPFDCFVHCKSWGNNGVQFHPNAHLIHTRELWRVQLQDRTLVRVTIR